MRTIRPRTLMRSGRGQPACYSKRGRTANRRQRDVLREVMLSASQCDTWLTLDELAKLTHYPPASISAQLRHLSKPRFGGYELQKRPRLYGRILRGEDFGTVWEYRLLRRVRSVFRPPRVLPVESRRVVSGSSG